jgi:hypothetical protein
MQKIYGVLGWISLWYLLRQEQLFMQEIMLRAPLVSEDALWVICIVIMWIRVFYFLRFNEFMGKFIGIVERLV